MMLPYDERDRANVLRDLGDSDPEVRRLAVERIDALDDSEALACLVERLGDPDWRVRKSTVQRIAERPDPDDSARKLIAALGDGENPGRRNSAVEALVAIGAHAVAALVSACEDDDADVRKFVVDALAGIGSDAATTALCARLTDADPNVRAAAADALGAVGGPAARAALRRIAVDAAQDPLVRFSAIHALDTLEEPMRADELVGVLGDPMLGPAGLALLGRCEEIRGADQRALGGDARALRDARHAEIRELRGDLATDSLHEHVFRLHVAMNDSILVCVREPVTHLAPDLDDLGERQRPGVTQRLAFDVLHHDERGAVRLAGIEHRHDVWVLEPRRRLRLAQPARARIGVDPAVRQQLDRDRSVEQRVARAIDRAHAAGAELGLDAIAILECAADHGGRESSGGRGLRASGNVTADARPGEGGAADP
jgi:hypothetical protein